MTVAHIPSPEAEIVARTWAASSDDRWYLVEVQARALACAEPPDWMIFRFAGPGELVADEVWAGVRDHLARLGFEVLDVTLTEVSENRLAEVTATHVTRAAPEPVRPPASAPGVLVAEDFAPTPAANHVPRPARRKRRR